MKTDLTRSNNHAAFRRKRRGLKALFSALALALALPIGLIAQTVTIKGTVTEEMASSPIPGANITIMGTTDGTVTNMDGKYSLEAPVNSTLVFSFIGYKTQKIIVDKSTTLDVVLVEETSVLDEMIVVGYGTSTVREASGATAKLDGKELTKLNVPRLDQGLQGQVSGVTINSNSGSPGGASSIRIRGLSTFGDNDPLILVDGIIYDSEGLNALNPNDIESINVLKDGTAGIYGVRAANGVIIITTKKGSANSRPTLEFSAYYGMQQTSKRLGLLNATEYAVIKNNAFINGGQTPPFANTQIGEGTDWQDEVFQSSPIANYNVSLFGGTNKSTYSFGISHFAQDGIVGGNKANFERTNVRLNISNTMSDELKLNSVFLYSNEGRSTLPENGIGSVLYNTVNAYPTEPVYQEDGNYSYLLNVNDIINPLAQIENTYNRANVNKFVGKEELVWHIDNHFTFTNRFNYNIALVDGKNFFPLVWYGLGKAQNTALNEDLESPVVSISPGVDLERGASVYQHRDTYTDLSFESFMNYDRVLENKNHFKATLGLSAFRRAGRGLGGTAYRIPNNSYEFADVLASQADGGYLNQVNGFEYEERLLSSFLRAEYKIDDKYIVSGIVRRDGSSKFGANNRWGYFPSISGAWIASNEKFYGKRKVDYLKVRMSYGVSGNDQIPNFAYRALLNGEGVYVFNDLLSQGIAIGRAANNDLKWETTAQFNAGLDFMIKDFGVTTNYFRKNTSDLLFQPDVSGVLGTYSAGGFPPYVNAGDVLNTGVELELRYQTDQKSDWVFTGSLNGTYIKNEVLRVPEGVEFIPGVQFGVGGNIATRFEEGFPIGYFIGMETDGIFQTQQEIDDAPVKQAGAKPGDLRYVDQDGDGKINFSDDSDRKMLGSPIPDFTFGANLRLAYKQFDLSTSLYAAVGQEIIRNYERQQPYANQLNYWIDRWTGPGSTDETPRVTTGSNRNTVFSDFFVEDGSFLRMRNLQLGYTLPEKIGMRARIKYARFYVAANNLFTLTNYRGFDPDIGNFGGTLAAGVDYGFYPQARTYMIGLNIKF